VEAIGRRSLIRHFVIPESKFDGQATVVA
jgi:hypothetical protein